MSVRPIVAIPLPEAVVPNVPETAPPALMMMSPLRLRVDDAYQRELSRKSIDLIHRIVADFDWRRFKPPVVTPGHDLPPESGIYDVIDGQHSAIAAASHGGFDEIPVLVVDATQGIDRARAFLGHNRDRVAMQATQLHYAAVAAGDEDAMTIQQVCERAGVKILRLPPPSGAFKPGQTLAIGAVTSLIRRRYSVKARIVLELCVQSGAVPVSADLIKAVDAILHDPDYAGDVSAENLLTAAMRLPEYSGRVSELATAKAIPRWRAMTIVLFQNSRKTRKAS